MNIYHIRQLLKTKSIYELNLRVAYYARVSTDKEEQKNSIKNQREHFEEYIKANKSWEFCGGYIDDGISGMHAEKREEFQRMLSDARNDKIDLIITKEISRFARNTLDSIQYTRQLLSYGVCVWFQNDNINTIDDDSEFRLTIMAGVAQDEIRKLSSRVRFGHAQSIKNGVVLGNSRIYGYDKQNGKLIINEKEAEMVRLIFEKYATGEWSTPKLEKLLYEKGYRNYKGGRINRGVINHIIKNPKYKGYYAGGKVKIIDMFTKKQEFLPEEEWNMFKDDGSRVPAIVDENIWNMANRYFNMRSETVKSRRTSFKNGNLFTGKIFCGNDGATYWMKQHYVRGKEDVKWVCSYRIKNGSESCDSFPIAESELRKMLSNIINESAKNIDEIARKYIEIYKKVVLNKKDNSEEIKRIQTAIDKTRNKIDKILDYNIEGIISDSEFSRRNSEYQLQIENMEAELKILIEEDNKNTNPDDRLFEIKRILESFSGIKEDEINEAIVNRLIDKIIVYPTGKRNAKIEFHLARNCGCSDNIFLIMLSERHTVFYRHLRSFSGHKMPIEYTYSLVA